MHDTSADRNPPKQQQLEQRVSSPLVELTTARLQEFLREPEAVFWVFAFPVLMTLALGVAFRTTKPADVNAGVLKQTSGASDGNAAATQADAMAKTLTDAGGIRVRVLSPPEAEVALRNGVVAVLVVPGNSADVSLRCESPRESPCTSDDRRGAAARGGASGRVDGDRSAGRDARLTLHRLADARPARHEHHGHGPVEHWLFGGDGAHAQAAEALDGDADAARLLLVVASARAAWFPRPRSRRAAVLRMARVRRDRRRARCCCCPGSVCSARFRSRASAC